MSTESTVWTGHPSHWHYFWAWFWGILLAVVVVGFFIIIWIFVDRARRTYTVTTGKVIMESGLVAKSSDEVRIKDIRSISVRKSGLTGLFGVGDLEFASAASDQAEITFRSIPKADEVRDLVRRYQES
jgi:uncharacterized membrane protein YdbT with pleckstrin-like domain